MLEAHQPEAAPEAQNEENLLEERIEATLSELTDAISLYPVVDWALNDLEEKELRELERAIEDAKKNLESEQNSAARIAIQKNLLNAYLRVVEIYENVD